MLSLYEHDYIVSCFGSYLFCGNCGSKVIVLREPQGLLHDMEPDTSGPLVSISTDGSQALIVGKSLHSAPFVPRDAAEGTSAVSLIKHNVFEYQFSLRCWWFVAFLMR